MKNFADIKKVSDNLHVIEEVLVLQGEVKFFHDEKKYGFIETEDMDDDVFFHINDLEIEEVEEGMEVEFDTEEGDKGPKAVNVVEA